ACNNSTPMRTLRALRRSGRLRMTRRMRSSLRTSRWRNSMAMTSDLCIAVLERATQLTHLIVLAEPRSRTKIVGLERIGASERQANHRDRLARFVRDNAEPEYLWMARDLGEVERRKNRTAMSADDWFELRQRPAL